MRRADIQFSIRGNAVIARLQGELDLSNASEVGEALAEGTANDLLALILDLSSLDYIDSAGIQLIYRLRESLRIRGQGLRIVIAPSSMAHDALRLAGVSGYADIVETLDQAFQALPAQAADADRSGSTGTG
jgi:anti-sigma B factor antagonist